MKTTSLSFNMIEEKELDYAENEKERVHKEKLAAIEATSAKEQREFEERMATAQRSHDKVMKTTTERQLDASDRKATQDTHAVTIAKLLAAAMKQRGLGFSDAHDCMATAEHILHGLGKDVRSEDLLTTTNAWIATNLGTRDFSRVQDPTYLSKTKLNLASAMKDAFIASQGTLETFKIIKLPDRLFRIYPVYSSKDAATFASSYVTPSKITGAKRKRVVDPFTSFRIPSKVKAVAATTR